MDYFDVIENKEDLKDIILLPSLETGIDFSDSAIDTIIEYSAGNPYYMMLLTGYCYDEILKRELSSVDKVDIEKMIKHQLEVISIQHFQHFWEDGKIGTENEEAWWQYYNSQILVLLSEILQLMDYVKYPQIRKTLEDSKVMGAPDLDLHLEQLVRRKVLCKIQEDQYKIRVRLLSEWLSVKGREEINLLFKNTHYLDDAIQASKKYEYSEENIRFLEKKFTNFYKEISKEDIRVYLSQYKALLGTREAWYAFKILENIKLYSRSDIERYFKRTIQFEYFK